MREGSDYQGAQPFLAFYLSALGKPSDFLPLDDIRLVFWPVNGLLIPDQLVDV